VGGPAERPPPILKRKGGMALIVTLVSAMMMPRVTLISLPGHVAQGLGLEARKTDDRSRVPGPLHFGRAAPGAARLFPVNASALIPSKRSLLPRPLPSPLVGAHVARNRHKLERMRSAGFGGASARLFGDLDSPRPCSAVVTGGWCGCRPSPAESGPGRGLMQPRGVGARSRRQDPPGAFAKEE